MTDFVSAEEAKRRSGLRMSVVGGVPSPWSQAAKGILYVKQIPYVAIRQAPGDATLEEWTGQQSAPVAMYEDERPRSGWAEILLLAERLAPDPALIPTNPEQRALVFGLSHEICGEMGLGWSRRLAAIHDGFESGGKQGFPVAICEYLAPKYGYRADNGAEAHHRVIDILGMLAARLGAQKRAGSRYYLSDDLTAVDIYSAAFAVLFQPLEEKLCPLPESLRAAFSQMNDATRRALDPIVLEHRDFVYEKHLELPIVL